MTDQKENPVKAHGLTVKVREKCLAAGFSTAYQLQIAANLSPSVAHDLFNETFTEISLETLAKLLNALDCTAADLFVKEKSEQDESKTRDESADLSLNPIQSAKVDFMTSETHPLRVDFIGSEEYPVLQKLGMTFAPGKKQTGALSGNWDRDMTADLARLRDVYQVDTLVSLIEESEFGELNINNFEYECRNHDIELIRFPLRDVSVPPSRTSFARLIREIAKRLTENKTVVIHCKGGLGRAGLTAACAIVAASGNKINGSEAIKMVRAARRGTVETGEQENYVLQFGAYWQSYIERTKEILRQQKTAEKEKVLFFGFFGGSAELYRFKTSDDKWYFSAGGSSLHLKEKDDSEEFDWENDNNSEWLFWENEPVETLAEGIDSLNLGFEILSFVPLFIHPEYRAEIKQYLENLYRTLTPDEENRISSFGDFSATAEEWLEKADREMASASGFDNFNQVNHQVETRETPSETEQNFPDKHFLLYWREENVVAHEASGYPLDVVSSRQLRRAKAGDTLWLATIDQAGELILAGRLRIGEIVDYQTAIRRLNDTSLWDGGFFALPRENEAEVLRRINLGETALDLRFSNSESDRFILKNGKINAQQLQTMRELTKDSAEMIARIWETEGKEENNDDFEDDLYNVKYFRQLVRKQPLNPLFHYKLGFHCDIKGLTEEANAAYRKAIELAPDSLIAYEALGHNYLRAGELDKAVQVFKSVVRLAPESAAAHYDLGVACDENDLTEEANAAYQKAIELDSHYWQAHYNLGQNYLRRSEFSNAEDAFITAALLNHGFAEAHFMLGVVYAAQNKHQDSIDATLRGLEFSPDDAKAHFNIGNSYFHLRDYEKAAEWFEKSLEIDQNAPDTYYRLGKCYRELGEKEKEFDAYLNAVELAPDFVDALFALGTLYAHLTETDEGREVTYFETGGDLILSDPRVSFYLGLGNLAHGNVDEARESQADLLKMDERLADQLQFFIDRFEPKIEETETAHTSNPKKNATKKRKLIEFYIDDQNFQAKNIPEMYQKALEYLVDATLLDDVSLPVATGEKRYILAKEPVHPTGKPFLAPVTYEGFFMEAHNNRTAATSQLKRLIESLGCTFGEIINFDPGMDDEPEPVEIDAEKLKRFQGCLLGGAVGDALGAPVEFDSIQTIRQKFGEQGLTDYAPAYGRIGAITDDTQMTIFTAEGLLRANTRYNHKGICSPPRVIYHAYLRWLETQGVKLSDETIKSWVYQTPSWLRDLPQLNSRRAPGNSCLSALQSGKMGTIEEPINNSKGCGGVMRVAPVGLIALDAFGLASEAAAITHGHPTGYLSAGVLALIIQEIIGGKTLIDAVNHAVYTILPQHQNHEETFAACARAIKLARDKTILPSPEAIESLGGGWIAEEALAIAIYCSLVYENDFKKAVLLAVNHSGDSDSTGAITGNILGALHGTEVIPNYWLERLELKDAITEIAEDLLIGFRTGEQWWNKYPGV
jgi:ADP-ribosylglycohydrolase/Flp pilus assembly protein TadD/protein-tyrosine phosphatase/DNA-binding Xre family transcriptional regulator